VRRSTKKLKKSSIDRWVYFAVIFGPIMTLPQVYDVWYMGKKEASAITWASYILIASIWLAYGIRHHERPIIIVQIIWIFLDIAILAGILL
jgi:uncharacterized protein with PQ loop repeat